MYIYIKKNSRKKRERNEERVWNCGSGNEIKRTEFKRASRTRHAPEHTHTNRHVTRVPHQSLSWTAQFYPSNDHRNKNKTDGHPRLESRSSAFAHVSSLTLQQKKNQQKGSIKNKNEKEKKNEKSKKRLKILSLHFFISRLLFDTTIFFVPRIFYNLFFPARMRM